MNPITKNTDAVICYSYRNKPSNQIRIISLILFGRANDSSGLGEQGTVCDGIFK